MADTHLGFSAYRKLRNDGMNQREMDIYDSFTQCIDYAIKSKPDLILHSGDLFDSVRPTNRAITNAFHQIIRLEKEKIPFVVISGNHETPRLKETGHIFKIFEHLDNIFPVYNNKYVSIPFKIKEKKIIIHAIPHCHTKKDFFDNIKGVKPDPSVDFNILMAHGAVTSVKEFKMNEFNELFIPTETLQKEFDYIALGHYHNFTQLGENAFYSGSCDRLSFAEANLKKGFIEIQFDEKFIFDFKEIHTRPMIDATPIDCSNLTIEEITNRILKTIQNINPNNKILRIRLKNISLQLYRSIDFNQIKKLCRESVHFEIKSDVIQEGEKCISENHKIESLTDEFTKFIEGQEIVEKDLVRQLGLKYIQQIQSTNEGR
jgi:DNA repair exonuclease SbcCD nuclease subunit